MWKSEMLAGYHWIDRIVMELSGGDLLKKESIIWNYTHDDLIEHYLFQNLLS